jgi:hypothetical protein
MKIPKWIKEGKVMGESEEIRRDESSEAIDRRCVMLGSKRLAKFRKAKVVNTYSLWTQTRTVSAEMQQ